MTPARRAWWLTKFYGLRTAQLLKTGFPVKVHFMSSAELFQAVMGFLFFGVWLIVGQIVAGDQF